MNARKLLVLASLVALVGLGAAYGLETHIWHAVVKVDQPAYRVEYSSNRLQAHASPHETLAVTSKGLAEAYTSLGLPSEPIPSAYKLYTVRLLSDRVTLTLTLNVTGADNSNLYFWVTNANIDPNSLQAWNAAAKLVPHNNTATITLDKKNGLEYTIWLDGTLKTGSSNTTTTITVTLAGTPAKP